MGFENYTPPPAVYPLQKSFRLTHEMRKAITARARAETMLTGYDVAEAELIRRAVTALLASPLPEAANYIGRDRSKPCNIVDNVSGGKYCFHCKAFALKGNQIECGVGHQQ